MEGSEGTRERERERGKVHLCGEVTRALRVSMRMPGCVRMHKGERITSRESAYAE